MMFDQLELEYLKLIERILTSSIYHSLVLNEKEALRDILINTIILKYKEDE